MEKIINHDQLRFVLEVQGWFNVQKLHNVIHYNRLMKIHMIILMKQVTIKKFNTHSK